MTACWPCVHRAADRIPTLPGHGKCKAWLSARQVFLSSGNDLHPDRAGELAGAPEETPNPGEAPDTLNGGSE